MMILNIAICHIMRIRMTITSCFRPFTLLNTIFSSSAPLRWHLSVGRVRFPSPEDFEAHPPPDTSSHPFSKTLSLRNLPVTHERCPLDRDDQKNHNFHIYFLWGIHINLQNDWFYANMTPTPGRPILARISSQNMFGWKVGYLQLKRYNAAKILSKDIWTNILRWKTGKLFTFFSIPT